MLESSLPLKVAVYSRVSTEEQAEGKTIESQALENENFCKERDYIMFEHYKDDGWSGGRLERPALDRLRDDAKLGLFNTVVINAVDRLARDDFYFALIVRELEKLGIKFVFIKTPFGEDTSSKTLRSMVSNFAALERANILERTRRGKIYKVKIRKMWIGVSPPYGYSYTYKNSHEGEPGHLDIKESEAEIIRKMFNWVSDEGISAREVVRRLTTMLIPTPKGGRIWQKSTVLRMLKKTEYIGKFYYNRVEAIETDNHKNEQRYRKNLKTGRRQRPQSEWIPLEMPHLRIIDDMTFSAVQDQLRRNICFAKRNTKNKYLFQGGLMKCGKCGSSYYGDSRRDGAFYRDGNRYLRFPLKKNCDSPSISVNKIEPMVWNTLVKLFSNPPFLAKYLKKSQEWIPNIGSESEEFTLLENEQKRLNDEESRLILGYQKGILTDEKRLKELLQKVREDKSVVADRIDFFRNKNKRSKTKITIPKNLNSFCKLIRKKMGNLEFSEKQKLVRQLLKEIIFDGEKVIIRGYIQVEPDFYNDSSTGKSSQNRKIATPKSLYYDCRWRRFLKLF